MRETDRHVPRIVLCAEFNDFRALLVTLDNVINDKPFAPFIDAE